MDAADGAMTQDQARLLFAAMVGVNMLSRAVGEAAWIDGLRKTIKDAAAEAR